MPCARSAPVFETLDRNLVGLHRYPLRAHQGPLAVTIHFMGALILILQQSTFS